VKRLGLFILFAFGTSVSAQEPAPLKETTVGVSGRLEGVVIPGPELVARKLDDRKLPIVVWITQTYPHGTDFRYDFEYYGLEPGTYDLRKYLFTRDGKPAGEAVKPMVVKVNPVRPPGQVLPNELQIEKSPYLGGYRWLMIGAIVVWGVGLLAIVAWMLSPLFRSKAVAAGVRRVSLADRLRPLVQGAIDGKLSHEDLAKLERGLHTLWRKRLNLEAAEPGAAIAKLRSHAEAGPLLGQLELWLHKPGPQTPVDVAALLAPYRELPPEALEL
jgi:hypothetical protein